MPRERAPRKFKIFAARTLKLNLGNYESVEVSESLEMETDDFAHKTDLAQLHREVDKRLDEAASAEVADRELKTSGNAPAGPVALSYKNRKTA